MKITILGCGSSGGAPLATGDFGKCCAEDLRNYRTRSSIAVHIGSQIWIIDTSPDFRYQCLREKITNIDGVLYTHAHYDHTAGLSDLKAFAIKQKKPMPIWADAGTMTDLKIMYPYAFQNENSGSIPKVYGAFIQENFIENEFLLENITVKPFVQHHGYSNSLGFRFPSWAYSTDVWELNDEAFSILDGVQLWIVDCISRNTQPTHAHLERTLSWIERIKPQQVVLTHMGVSLDYEKLKSELPDHIVPAYDGMIIETPE